VVGTAGELLVWVKDCCADVVVVVVVVVGESVVCKKPAFGRDGGSVA